MKWLYVTLIMVTFIVAVQLAERIKNTIGTHEVKIIHGGVEK